METTIFNWLLDIPSVVGQFGNWLTTPIYEPYISLSPLALLGIGGVGTIIAIIGLHVVRLFI